MKKKRILAVDDMFPILRMVKLLLRDEFNIATVPSGQDAIKLLEADNIEFDLMLLDIDMPVLTGFDVLDKIKNNQDHPHLQNLPVIMLTSKSDEDTVVRAIKAGAVDYIVKPFTKDILKKRLRAVLDK